MPELNLDLIDHQRLATRAQSLEMPQGFFRVVDSVSEPFHRSETPLEIGPPTSQTLPGGHASVGPIQVEAALEQVQGTTQLAALALFDDKDRAGDVLSRLNKERRDYADAFKTCQSGAHEAIDFDTAALVKGTENLTKWLRTQS